MKRALLLSIWLLVLIVGLPQLAETIFTPSLPLIATSFGTSASMAQFTLTIYLFSFALGTLFWGRISDKHGRKPSILLGLIIFALGSAVCYISSNIEILMLGRFIQAFGGSTGSVVGQAICRDSFEGSRLGQVYSFIGGSLGLFPALGPIIGGFIAYSYGWRNVFTLLIGVTFLLILTIVYKLPETHHKESRQHHHFLKIVKHLLSDKKVLGFGLIVAAANGVWLSYFTEGAFYLIDNLHLSPLSYSFSFILIVLAIILGTLVSKKLNKLYSSLQIMRWGITTMTMAALLFSITALIKHYAMFSDTAMIVFSLSIQMVIVTGFCLVTSNALSLALVDYKWCVGSATSLFGFFYYLLISLFTLGMGLLHNGTLLPMPLYFFALCLLMKLSTKLVIKPSTTS
ncbi:Bcr/CflA family drug resistance efflux transporter [Candidatus Aerophobetes bacterium]|uniref:Bcr/CflA family drug resistance efflux transporter n=1 Tax=Aerophobetes bacterium TaxID=2030807 RepID=A0A2A4X6M6_UNCAE|nr:MAG: Bcr/CflA family drug resistance efflux transporter [Candidatus Aerophobetes bacterium]